MINRWKKLTSGEKLRAQLVIGFLIVGLYGLVFYPLSSNKLTEAEKMLRRRSDRIEKRANIDNLGTDGLNTKVIQRKIEKTDKLIQEVYASFDELDTGFAPIESADVRQQLLLEISKLAERTNIEILSVLRKKLSLKDDPQAVYVDPLLKRPILIIKLNAYYWNLLEFLQGLKDLSFYVSVMNIKLYSTPPPPR